MATSPEQLLISSILREGAFALAAEQGIDQRHFIARLAEWIFLEDYYAKYRKTPSRLVFRQSFPDFQIKPATDVLFYADELKRHYTRRLLTASMKDVADFITDGEVDAALERMREGVIMVASEAMPGEDGDIFSKHDDVMKEITARHDRFQNNGTSGVPTGISVVDDYTGGMGPNEHWIIAARQGQGKMLSNDELVLTPEGWVKNGTLKTGDRVMGSDGKPTNVIAVWPHKQKQVHLVRLTDGTEIRSGDEHLWNVRYGTKPFRTQTTVQIMEHLRKHPDITVALPVLSGPAVFTQQAEAPYEPYQMGLLLGDGCFRGSMVSFTTADEELALPFGRNAKKWSSKFQYGIGRIKPRMEREGLWGLKSKDKFIPERYFLASPADRLALLQGLMDTDGHVSTEGQIVFSSSSEKLVDGVRELVWSLGGTTSKKRMKIPTINGVEHQPHYSTTLAMPAGMVPFRLQRKVDRCRERTEYFPARYIKEIVVLDEFEDMTCISVDNPDSLYVTRNYVITHNSWLLQYISTYATLAGYNTYFAALEQTRAQVSMRIWAMMSSMIGNTVFSSEQLMRGKDYDLKELGKFIRWMQAEQQRRGFGNLVVADNQKTKITPLSLQAQIDKHSPDVVFIDYIQLMNQNRGMGPAALADVVNEVTGITNSKGIPVVSASQLNREAAYAAKEKGGSEAGTENLTGSDQLGHDASVVLTLAQKSQSVSYLKNVKNRYGVGGWGTWLDFRPDAGVINPISEDRALDQMDTDAFNQKQRATQAMNSMTRKLKVATHIDPAKQRQRKLKLLSENKFRKGA